MAKTGDFHGHQRGHQLAKTGDFSVATDSQSAATHLHNPSPLSNSDGSFLCRRRLNTVNSPRSRRQRTAARPSLSQSLPLSTGC
jgi:hypothetical protein